MGVTVLVAYASADGSTAEIARFIGDELTRRGARVEVQSVTDLPDPAPWDAVVLGSAIHNMSWLPVADEYVRRFRSTLANKDIWLYSVGLGPALRGPIGRRIGRATPRSTSELVRSVHPRDHQGFAGVFDRKHTSRLTRAIYRAIGGGRYGDLREWGQIRRWADDIAEALSAAGTSQAEEPDGRPR